MKKLTTLLVCLAFSLSCRTSNAVSTHETVEKSAVSLEFVTETAGNGVIVHFVEPNIYYVLSAGHLCNVGVHLEYIIQWLTSNKKSLIDRAKENLALLQEAITSKMYCAPSIKQDVSIGIRGKALAIDFDKDLSLFMFTSDKALGVSKIDTEILPVFGQDIYAYGYVFHPGFTNIGLTFFGKVGSVFPMSLSPSTQNSPTVVVQSSLGVSHGLSGSGVYTMDHVLLGILSAEASLGVHKPIRLSLFIHPAVVRLFLAQAIEHYKKNIKEKTITPYCSSSDPILCDAFLGKKFNVYKEIEKKLNGR